MFVYPCLQNFELYTYLDLLTATHSGLSTIGAPLLPPTPFPCHPNQSKQMGSLWRTDPLKVSSYEQCFPTLEGSFSLLFV